MMSDLHGYLQKSSQLDKTGEIYDDIHFSNDIIRNQYLVSKFFFKTDSQYAASTDRHHTSLGARCHEWTPSRRPSLHRGLSRGHRCVQTSLKAPVRRRPGPVGTTTHRVAAQSTCRRCPSRDVLQSPDTNPKYLQSKSTHLPRLAGCPLTFAANLLQGGYDLWIPLNQQYQNNEENKMTKHQIT